MMQEVERPFGYTGYRYNNVSKTYFTQAREYLPHEGRFFSEDVIGQVPGYAETINKYHYCYSNPVIFVDRDGRCPFLVTAGIGAIAGAVIGSGVGAVGALATSAGVAAGTVATIETGALVGGVTSGTIDMGMQIWNDEKIDMGKVAISGATGTISGMVMGSPASRELSVGLNTGISATQAMVTNIYTGDTEYIMAKTVIGAVAGAFGGYIGGAGASFGNATVRENINIVLNTQIVKEHIEKTVINKALTSSAIISGLYGMASSIIISQLEEQIFKNKTEEAYIAKE